MRAIVLGIFGCITFANGAASQGVVRSAQSLECSRQADAQTLHGIERKAFMSQCKATNGRPAQAAVAPQASQLPSPPVAPGANQPSFNCANAKTAPARLICSDAELANVDGALGKAFQNAVRSLSADDKKNKIQEQVTWLRERNRRCQLDDKLAAPVEELAEAKPCMLSWINIRIAELVGTSKEPPKAAATPATLTSNDLCLNISTSCINRCNGDSACRNSCTINLDQCKSAQPDTVINPPTQPSLAQTGTNDATAFSKLRQEVRVFVPPDRNGMIQGPYDGWPMVQLTIDFKTVDEAIFLDAAQTLRMLNFLRSEGIKFLRNQGTPIQRYVFIRFDYGGYQESFAAYSDGENGSWNIYNKTILDNIRNRMANEQAQRDLAAQRARNADTMRTNMENFTSKTAIQQWIDREDLRSNAIRFKGQIVGVFAYFNQLESETEGIFGNSTVGPTDTLIVKGIDATKLKKDQQVIMAIKVNGLRPYSGVQVPDLSLVGIAYCLQQHCSEFGNIPN